MKCMKKYIFRKSTAWALDGTYIISVYEISDENELMYICHLKANIFLFRSDILIGWTITRYFEKCRHKPQTANEYYEEIHLF